MTEVKAKTFASHPAIWYTVQMNFHLASRCALIAAGVFFTTSCAPAQQGEEKRAVENEVPPESGSIEESNEALVSALIPIPPSFVLADRKRGIAGLFEDLTGKKITEGTRLQVNLQTNQILVHHEPKAVAAFKEAMAGQSLYLNYEEAFRSYTNLFVEVWCLSPAFEEEFVHPQVATSLEKAHAGNVIDLGNPRFKYQLEDHDTLLIESGDTRSWLREPWFSVGFTDQDFFADSCWINLRYAIPGSPNTRLVLDSVHFAPGTEQRFEMAGGYLVIACVYLISDFPIPTRMAWEKVHGTRLDDYHRSLQVFSFDEGKAMRYTLSDAVYKPDLRWDFLYEPNQIGLGAFNHEVSLMAQKPSKFNEASEPVDPFSGTPPDQIGDLGGICDLGDVPLDEAKIPEGAQFVPFIPKPSSHSTYAIRNRKGEVAGYIRPMWVNFSKGDASSMRFFWRRAE